MLMIKRNGNVYNDKCGRLDAPFLLRKKEKKSEKYHFAPLFSYARFVGICYFCSCSLICFYIGYDL